MDAKAKKTLGKVLVGVLATGVVGTAGFFGYKFYMKKKEEGATGGSSAVANPDEEVISENPTGGEAGTRNLNVITDPKLKAITEKLIKDARFDSVADAQYFMDNIQSIPPVTKPNSDQIRAGLRNSNMAFYDGKAEKRLTFWEVDKMNQQNLWKSKNEGWAMIRFAGGFESPAFNKYTPYQLKRLLAHGWWFGMTPVGGTGYKMGIAEDGGNAYYVAPMGMGRPGSAAQENGSVYSGVAMPSSLKGEEYSYAFNGKLI